ncbi:MAG: DUF4147 domain-containing protein [Pirellulales bacterium]|nr:DUF4147 domain-containing protein [Pirellulales bacterium]
MWQAGLAAVRSERLMRDAVALDGSLLTVGDDVIDLTRIERIAVVGAGKAGAGMAAELEAILGPELLAAKRVQGWINVPADCVRPLAAIHLHAARPAGVNEPTAEGVSGAERILELVAGLGPHDLCLCLISGGASALLPAPASGITLADKLALTRHLSGAGANIAELNIVRKQLSRIKGGRLAAACRAGQCVNLVISDVLGDPLDLIGSGPTVPDRSTPADALAILEHYRAHEAGIGAPVFELLRSAQGRPAPRVTARVANHLIGNNARAVDAAGVEAVRRGYAYLLEAATTLEGEADDIGRALARRALVMRAGPGPDCLISGGEPVVKLAPVSERGRGGRNQQLVLAALVDLLAASPGARHAIEGIALLSGGTDGEDGPTDAAGAWLDESLPDAIRNRGLDPREHLRRNDAYPFFDQTGHLLKTGPTHTNVCDLRVVLVDRRAN